MQLSDDSFYKARVVHDDFVWNVPRQKMAPLQDCVIYELHVRGFTQHESAGVTHRGTFAGIMEKIPYLQDLGINAVELMPVFEFDETRGMREVNGETLLDYWGYNPVSFFAPNTSYSAEIEYNREGTELKRLIRSLHDHGIRVIFDVVFNHTAEGDERGPFFSFKGIDNNVYYMLTPDGKYYNFSGCGNTLNCNHPMVRDLILNCLRYWTVAYHVDGFRFDLASILGRDEQGAPMNNPPLLESLAYDPILSASDLIAEAWDAGGLYQVGSFPNWTAGRNGMAVTAMICAASSRAMRDMPWRQPCASSAPRICIRRMKERALRSTSSLAMMASPCMICMHITRNTMRATAGTIPMVRMTTAVGTAEPKAKAMTRKYVLCAGR